LRRAENEHREANGEHQTDAQIPEVDRDVRVVDRGLEIARGVERVRALQEEQLGHGVNDQAADADAPVE
jgi:hypothetical protein